MLPCNADKVIVNEATGTDWYSQENMDRLWNDARESGKFLVCHSTDKDAATYGGDLNVKTEKKKVCLGFTVWVFMHIKVYESVKCSFTKYQKAVGLDVAMSKWAMGEAAFSIQLGNASLLGTLPIAREFDPTQELRYPTGFEKTIQLFKKIISNG